MSVEHERLKEILAEASGKTLPAIRAAYLDAACQGDAELRDCVEALLHAHDSAGDFLGRPVVPPIMDSVTEEAGTMIGRYKLLMKIGEGGFGVVYLAEQREPVFRRVALKLIKAGMDTREVVARFEAERQALALMDHPNIAKVFDGGVVGAEPDSPNSALNFRLAGGRPFFVMELVEGIPITDYCDQELLGTEDRLSLFIEVCHAVQHAHQKGIIHRDLKPSNVMVTVVDGQPVPKIIDFGVAKALGQKLTEKTLLTLGQQIIGTPAYMSPEQATLGGVDIDTRSDIYALGVLLYELLTGVTPFDAETIAKAGLDEVQRIIREQEPARPSTRISTLGQRGPTIARCRQVDPPLLRRTLRGDLDWITMRAMEKDRARRYATASDLAEDIVRHLEHEPVSAGPPGTLYRANKFVRRHRMGVVVFTSIFALVCGGLLMAMVALVNVRTQRDRAVLAEQRTELSRREAVQQRLLAEASLRRMDLQTARGLFARGESSRALSLLAYRLRQDPADSVVAEWLLNELMQRTYALPVIPPIVHDDLVTFARFSPDGRRLLTVAHNNTARVWDAVTGGAITPLLRHESGAVRPGELFAGMHPLWADFSPDGRRVVTGSVDKTARVWDVETGVPITIPLVHPDWVCWVGFSPDGALVVTGCKDGKVRLWNSTSGALTVLPLHHEKWINTAEFSPDGRFLVSASDDKTARIWEVETGKPVGPSLLHNGAVRHASFSPDGMRVVTASGDRKARYWDAQTGQPQGQVMLHGGMVLWARFSPDGSVLATACWDKTVRFWDGLTGEPVGQPIEHQDVVRDIRFSPDGLRLAAASRDKTARVYDVRTQEPLTEPIRHHDAVWTAEFSPDGQSLVTASADRTVQIWDIRPGRALVHALPHPVRVISVAWSPDEDRILGVSAARVSVWQAETGYPVEGWSLAQIKSITCARFSPDGSRLVIASASGSAHIFDGAGLQPLTPPLMHEGSVLYAEFSPDGRLVVTASQDRAAHLWGSLSGKPAGAPLRHGESVRTARFSPDGTSVVTASVDQTARVWKVATGDAITPPLQHSDIVVSARFSPSGKHVLTVSRDRTARVWDAGSGSPISPPLQHNAAVLSGEFNPDGRRVVTASADGTARIWDWQGGRPVGELLAHQGSVYWAGFSADGQRVATGSADRTALVWDAKTGCPVSTAMKHSGLLESLQFSRDGRRLVTGSYDYYVRVWELARAGSVAPDWLPELAEAVAGECFNSQRVTEDVEPSRFLELKARLLLLPGEGDEVRWVKWFLADRSTRSVSPSANHSSRGFVERLITRWPGWRFLSFWFEAAKLEPTNGLVCAGIAWNGMDAPDADKMLDQTIQWNSRRALQLLPDHPMVWRTSARVLERYGDTNAALAVLDRGRSLKDPYYWSEWAGALERAGRISEAWQKWNGVFSMLETQSTPADSTRLSFGQSGSEFMRKHSSLLGQNFPRGVERVRKILGISARNSDCPPFLIDLTAFYSCGLDVPWLAPEFQYRDLGTLPLGCTRLNNVDYDFRGLVQANGGALEEKHGPFLQRFDGIPVRQRCRRLHFLNATDVAGVAGIIVASYAVHYADGQVLEIPAVYGQDIGACRLQGDAAELRMPGVVWRDRLGEGISLQLYVLSWDNPRPDVCIEAIDFVSHNTRAAPFLIAITAQP